MKRFAMWLFCNTLFVCGYLWHWSVLRFDCMFFTYPVYDFLMCKSEAINSKYNFNVWGDIIKGENDGN